MLIAHVNRWDGSSLAASGQLGSMFVQYTQTNPVGKKWRAGSNQAYIHFDYGSAVSWQVFALIGGNFNVGSSFWRVRLSNTAPGSNDVLDTASRSTGVSSGYMNAFYVNSNAVSARYGRIDVMQVNTYIDVGRVFGGPLWAPTGDSVGRAIGWYDDSSRAYSIGGQLLSAVGPRYRMFEFEIEDVSSSMLANAFELDRSKGLTGDVLIMLEETNNPQTLSMYGTIERTTPIEHHAITHSRKRYIVRERL